MNRWRQLGELGQSVWLDYIRRSLMTSGRLERLIEEDGLKGMTSNPSIFEKAIVGSDEYREDLRTIGRGGGDPKSIYERIAIHDIRRAATVLDPVFRRTDRRDGYVSLEVSPGLAHETEGTREEARRLWNEVGRENLMIKVPGTSEGFPAIERLISEGINVNVTLLFSREAYGKAAEAYIRGLERLVASGGDPGRIAGVASFFVSRIDTAVDRLLESRIEEATTEGRKADLRALFGKTAIANAKLAYQDFERIFDGQRWAHLGRKGARRQRLLWASTSTKDPAYRDVLYIEELIGRDTVTTVPPDTYEAFLDHGEVRPSLGEDPDGAREILAALERNGISIDEVTEDLLSDGVRLFAEALEKLLATVGSACGCAPGDRGR